MSYIVDRFIILFLSLYLFYVMGGANTVTMNLVQGPFDDVALVLIMVIITCMLCCASDRKPKGIITFIYAMTAFFMPSFAVLSPVIIYDIFGSRLVIQGAVMLIAILKTADFDIFIMAAVLGAIACLLNYRSSKNEKMAEYAKKVRDDSHEKNLLLIDKNKHLREKQDYEIYVATLKERNRIAREIHDNVGHMLTRSILQMGALMTVNKEEPIHGQLSQVKDSLDTAMNNIRESVHDLHDEAIDLKQAVSDAVSPLEGKFIYKFEYDISMDVARQYKYAMISIVKEGVSNIIKYSHNDMVDITLREHPAMYQIIIYDYPQKATGKNKNQEAAKLNKMGYMGGSDGIGLQNIKDRVDALHGNVTITKDMGYKIFITLPKR